MDTKNKLRNKWSVFKESHPTGHIFVMILMVNVAFILFSALVISVLPENRGRSLFEILRLAFTLMVNPSGKYTYSEAPISLIFTTLVVLFGMISLTGGTVGFITSVISGFLEKTADSKRPLKLRDHIVILNYNQRVPSILCDYCFDDVSSTFIVILTDMDKDVVSKKIAEMLNHAGMKKRFRNVIVRNGNPMSKLDLDSICFTEARTVLLMTPENSSGKEAGFAVSKQFLFVNCCLSEVKGDKAPHIVVETNDDDMDSLVRSCQMKEKDNKVISVQHTQIIGKILGITTIMPTINDVLRQLFSFEGTEIYIRKAPKKSIEKELKTSNSVMPLFDMDGKRVYIAENEEEFDKTAPAFTLKKPLPDKPIEPRFSFSKNEIVVVGINKKLPYILESLICFRREYNNTQLHAILCDTPDKKEELDTYYSDPRYAEILMPEKYAPVYINNIYKPMDELRRVVNEATDTALFLSDEDVSDTLIDEKPLLYWSDIKTTLTGKCDPDIVVEIRNPENQSIIRLKNRDQILVSDDFMGHLYAQLGKNPERLGVIMDMITSEGDSSSVNEDNEEQNAGDLLTLRVGTMFGDKYDLSFSSKRELILWVYEATGKKVLPVGIARGGVSYLFSRIDKDTDNLDGCALLGIKDDMRLDLRKLSLKPDDELIAFVQS